MGSSARIYAVLTAVALTGCETSSSFFGANDGSAGGLDLLSISATLRTMGGKSCVLPYNGLYTRLLVEPDGLDLAGTPGDAKEQEKGWKSRFRAIKNFVVPEKETLTFNVKAKIEEILPERTSAIYLSVQNDNDKTLGKLRETEIYTYLPLSPYFLASTETVVSLGAEAKRQSVASPRLFKMLLETTLAASKMLAPGSNVLTTLSKPAFDRQAAIFDASLGRMASETVAEKVYGDITLGQWQRTAKFSAVLTHTKNDKDESSLGPWLVRLDSPRPSIFSDVSIPDPALDPTAECVDAALSADKERAKLDELVYAAKKAAFASIHANPNAVLGFKLKEGTTVLTHLRGLNWYEGMIAKINDAATRDEGKQALCSNVAHEILALGLNATDADIVAWALLREVAKEEPSAANLKNITSCKGVLNL